MLISFQQKIRKNNKIKKSGSLIERNYFFINNIGYIHSYNLRDLILSLDRGLSQIKIE
jgi:hypothetical protein